MRPWNINKRNGPYLRGIQALLRVILRLLILRRYLIRRNQRRHLIHGGRHSTEREVQRWDPWLLVRVPDPGSNCHSIQTDYCQFRKTCGVNLLLLGRRVNDRMLIDLRKVHVRSSRSGTGGSSGGMWDPSDTSTDSYFDSHFFPQDTIVPKASSTFSINTIC